MYVLGCDSRDAGDAAPFASEDLVKKLERSEDNMLLTI